MSLSGSDNWATLAKFTSMVQTVASIGAWPILLTQVSLRRARLHSTYYLALSTASLTLAIITSATTSFPSDKEMHKLFRGQNDIAECGGNPSLLLFCGPTFIISLSSRPIIMGLFLSFMGLLWLEKIRDMIAGKRWLQKTRQRLTQRQQQVATWARLILTKIVAIFLFLWEICLIIFFAFSVVDLEFLRMEVDEAEWGVGQVIAVLIWAPVISKYFYLIICELN